MKTILIFVSTLDGKITKWGNPHVKIWSSHQDQDYYRKIWDNSRLIVMGSKTFKAEPLHPSPDHHLIVMTRNPSSYENSTVPGQLEFTSETPAEIVERFKTERRKRMLVVGGPHIATLFLKAQLIDELWLTIEPKIFGTGGNFVTEHELDINLRLIQFEKVNEEGTLITKYEVIK